MRSPLSLPRRVVSALLQELRAEVSWDSCFLLMTRPHPICLQILSALSLSGLEPDPFSPLPPVSRCPSHHYGRKSPLKEVLSVIPLLEPSTDSPSHSEQSQQLQGLWVPQGPTPSHSALITCLVLTSPQLGPHHSAYRSTDARDSFPLGSHS